MQNSKNESGNNKDSTLREDQLKKEQQPGTTRSTSQMKEKDSSSTPGNDWSRDNSSQREDTQENQSDRNRNR